MDEASPLKTQKPWIIEVTFSKSKSEKNVKLDFHIKFWMSFKKVTAELNKLVGKGLKSECIVKGQI